VRQLDTGEAPLPVEEPHDARQRLEVRVAPDPDILRADARLRQNRRRLHEDQAGAAHRAAAEVNQMPLVNKAVDARVLAHRRNGDAVGKPKRAEFQVVEEMRHASAFLSFAMAAASHGSGRRE